MFLIKNEKCVACATHDRSIHDFHRDFFTGALSNGFNNGTDLFCDPTLAADDLAHVTFGNTQLQHLTLFTIDADKAKTWIKNGAQPTDTVRGLLKKAGVL